MEVLKTMKDLKPFQRMQNVYINHFDTKMINFSLKGFKIILKAHGDVARAIYTQFKRNKYIYTYIYPNLNIHHFHMEVIYLNFL